MKGNPSSQMWSFVQLCSSWQDFNWLKASRGPSAIAELLVGWPFVKRFALYYHTVVCLSVCDVGVLWPNGWMHWHCWAKWWWQYFHWCHFCTCLMTKWLNTLENVSQSIHELFTCWDGRPFCHNRRAEKWGRWAAVHLSVEHSSSPTIPAPKCGSMKTNLFVLKPTTSYGFSIYVLFL